MGTSGADAGAGVNPGQPGDGTAAVPKQQQQHSHSLLVLLQRVPSSVQHALRQGAV